MLKIKPPDYKYCPFCSKPLENKMQEGVIWKYCPKDNWTYYPHAYQASNAIIIKDKKILLVQRNREPYKGKWMFPAGFLNYGEHPKETAIREVREETGLNVKSTELFDVLQAKDDPRAPGNITFYYKIKAEGKLKNGDKDENSDIRWFDLDKIPPIAWKDHKAIINRLQKNRLFGFKKNNT